MKMKKEITAIIAAIVLCLSVVSGPTYASSEESAWWDVTSYPVSDYSLASEELTTESSFAGQRTLTGTVDGEAVTITHYWGWYCENPNSVKQRINIYVPSTATENSGVYLIVDNAGWQSSSYPNTISDGFAYSSDLENGGSGIGRALSDNMIVVSYGARSRVDDAVDGEYLGHSPAVIADTKAVIRFVKYNMIYGSLTGNPDRIVINGHSGGGGLSSTVGASGNSSDYFDALYEIGALGLEKDGDTYVNTVGDDIFAVMASAPIIDLFVNDYGYEWQYGSMRILADTEDFEGAPAAKDKDYEEWEIAASEVLADSGVYVEYMESLGFTEAQVQRIILDMAEAALEDALEGDFYIQSLADVSQVQTAEDAEEFLCTLLRYALDGSCEDFDELPLDWFTVTGSAEEGFEVSISDDSFEDFIAYTYWTAQWVKDVLPSDNLLCYEEPTFFYDNDLWGTTEQQANHTNIVSWMVDTSNNQYDASGEFGTADEILTLFVLGDDGRYEVIESAQSAYAEFASSEVGQLIQKQGKMATPNIYLAQDVEEGECDTAAYWYVRNGLHDDGISFGSLAMLYGNLQALQEQGIIEDVNFEFVVNMGHTDNVNTEEAWQWLENVMAANAES